MIVFKCKMCGGDLDIGKGSRIATCEYCGSKQTILAADDEKRIHYFNRANTYRQNGEFDKAMGIYDQVLADDPEDAEAYWTIVLCRYGIQYVEDPATKKRKPTMNRLQQRSIFKDKDYILALEHADSSQKEIYEKEASEIDYIQREILSIAQKEAPYDVFISYKEKAPNGDRTRSSVLAQNLYDRLTQAGYKVFFSRISLEDKIGQKYEPYIYAALTSARVMLVIGTKVEEFEAPWVRNEWNRYLFMMRDNLNKTLIPCFRDLSVEDLPWEFQNLQCQDMSKIGFEQDLIRGIGKLIPKTQPVQPGSKVAEAASSENKSWTKDDLVSYAKSFLSLQDYASANKIYKDLTDQYPADYRGWFGLIQAKTDNFSNVDLSFVQANGGQLNAWFERVKKLTNDRQFEEPLRLYQEYWEKISMEKAKLECKEAEDRIVQYAKEMQKVETYANGIQKKIAEQRLRFTNLCEDAKQDKKSKEEEIVLLTEQIATKRILNIKRLAIFLCELVVALILGFIIVGGLLFWGDDYAPIKMLFFIVIIVCVIVSNVRWVSTWKYGSKKQLQKRIAELEKEIGTTDKRVPEEERNYRQAVKNLQKQKDAVQPQKDEIQHKIDECKKYVNSDAKARAALIYAEDCLKFGEQVMIDQELAELRKKVLSK